MESSTISHHGEIVFWKVIHNKFLFRLIFNHIHTTRWIEYKEINQIHVDNRMKFKDMDTLELMVENCQFQLLKCKLEKNEYFLIEIESIGKLFSTISEMNRNEEFKLQLFKSTNIQSTESLLKLFNEILILLLNNKRNQFEIYDLTKLAIRYDCIFAFNILINDPYNIKVYPSTLGFGIQFCSVEIVKTLLNLQIKSYGKIIIGKELKKKSIILASNNEDHYEEMIEFIFSNSNLYSVPVCQPPLNQQQKQNNKSQRPKKKSKKEIDEEFELSDSGNDDDDDEDIGYRNFLKDRETKVSFKIFKSLKSIDIRYKLMEWDLVSKLLDRDNSNITFNYESFGLPFDELLCMYKSYKKYSSLYPISNEINKEIETIVNNKDGCKGFNKSKELQKLIIIKEGDFSPISYLEYMNYYKESIPELQKINNEEISKNDGTDKSNLINLYSYISHIYSNKYTGDGKEKQVNCIPILNNLEYRNGEKCGVFVIREKSTIDWLANNNIPYLTLLLNEIYRGKLEFDTFELFNYAITSKLNSKIFNKESCLVPFFINAIKSYDIKQLKIIQSTGIKLTGFGKEYSFNETVTTTTNNNNQQEMVIKLIEYLNENNYLNYSLGWFSSLFDHLLTILPNACEIIKLKLDLLSNHTVELLNLIMSSIFEPKFKLTEFLLSNINDGSLVISNDQLQIIKSKPKYIFSEAREIYQISNQEPDQIVKVIKLLVKKTKSFKLIEYLFDILLQIKETTIEHVENIVQLFKDNSIIQVHGLYQLFYYLYIKDPRLSKYLLSFQNISTIITINNFLYEENGGMYYDCKMETIDEDDDDEEAYRVGYPDTCFNISNHLKPDIFTYEFIFSNSFDQVLEKLVYHFSMTEQSIKDHSKDSVTYSQLLNLNLGYFIDIHRMDLFFKLLEIIQMELKSSNENQQYKPHDKSFPTIVFQVDSPSTTIKPTCQLLSNNTKLKYMYENQLTCQPKSIESFISTIKDNGFGICSTRLINSFKFQSKVLSNSLKFMTIDQIEQLFEFNFFVHQFQYDLLFESLSISRFDIVDLIYTNFNIPIYSLNRINFDISNTNFHIQGTSTLKLIKDYIKYILIPNSSTYQDQFEKQLFQNTFLEYLTSKLLSSKYSISKIEKICKSSSSLNNYLISLKNDYQPELPIDVPSVIKSSSPTSSSSSSKIPFFNSLSKIYNSPEFQSVVKSFFQNYFNNNNTTQSIKEQSIDYNENTFLEHFIEGDVIICDLILLHFPDIKFKITKNSISDAINNNQITIIKYYFNKFIKPNNNLLIHLRNQLLNHKDYKYNLDWC